MKKQINGKILALVSFIILVIVCLIKIPDYNTDNALKNLGYSEEEIILIKKKKLNESFIENSWYSPLLASEIRNDDFDLSYIDLYLNLESFDEEDRKLYNILLEKYSKEELMTLFSCLEYEDIKPLILFDKLEDEDDIEDYIEDISSHGLEGLKGSYIKAYGHVETIAEPSGLDVLVNVNHDLGEYEPELVKLSTYNSTEGIYLDSRAQEAFENNLCEALRNAGVPVYAIGGYVSYDIQQKRFDYFDLEEEATERYIFKAGFNEKQTGLIVTVVDSASNNINLFKESEAYEWLKEHAHEYGFIFRYPLEKTAITLMRDDCQNELRYLGVELATKVYESGLCYEEYIAYSETLLSR